jgi:predicted DNA-binding ribbon-helix-helix protein
MAILRVKEVAESKEVKLNQLLQTINTERARANKPFVAIGTMRRYWHSTEDGTLKGKELDQISWGFMQEIAKILQVSVYDLLPVEDGLGNRVPALHEEAA